MSPATSPRIRAATASRFTIRATRNCRPASARWHGFGAFTRVDENRFCLYAQPILGLNPDNAAEAHAEILIRMRERDGRLIAPGEFIGSAERYGLMPLIDRWVVKNALQELSVRGARFAMRGINVSGATFCDEDFVNFVREQFRITGLDPASICFEITETAAITNLAAADKFVRSLKALGCSFALDDFGAGMSSFAYLKNMPVDYIKIDGSFVRHMLDDTTDHAIIDLIARLRQCHGHAHHRRIRRERRHDRPPARNRRRLCPRLWHQRAEATGRFDPRIAASCAGGPCADAPRGGVTRERSGILILPGF